MNGMGSLVIDAVQNRDAPLIQGLVLMTALVVLTINLLVDISYGYFNRERLFWSDCAAVGMRWLL